jgi:hypothetical protein
MDTMHKKILIGAAAIVALLAGYRFMNDNGIIGKSIAEERAAGQCNADAMALFLKASSTDFATDKEAVAAVFANLMRGYMGMSGCRQVHLSDYSLDSVSIASFTDRGIMADIAYSVEPSDIRSTGWALSGERDGFWIRGIETRLNVARTSDGFFLPI